MDDFTESWKNKKVFEYQIAKNLEELNGEYPPHWKMFRAFMEILTKSPYNVKSILDVACGAGVFYKICQKHFPDVQYTGVDYAQEAVDMAKKSWNYDNFFVQNYKELTKEQIKKYDIINVCSLHNVLPNGDEVLKFFLDLGPKCIIFGKLLTSNQPSYFNVYKAYGEITTYLFYNNIDYVKNLFKQYNYSVYCNQSDLPTEYLLIKK